MSAPLDEDRGSGPPATCQRAGGIEEASTNGALAIRFIEWDTAGMRHEG